MERFIQLNLNTTSEKTESTNLPEPERREKEAAEATRKINRIARRAAHKAASEFGRSKTGLFSK